MPNNRNSTVLNSNHILAKNVEFEVLILFLLAISTFSASFIHSSNIFIYVISVVLLVAYLLRRLEFVGIIENMIKARYKDYIDLRLEESEDIIRNDVWSMYYTIKENKEINSNSALIKEYNYNENRPLDAVSEIIEDANKTYIAYQTCLIDGLRFKLHRVCIIFTTIIALIIFATGKVIIRGTWPCLIGIVICEFLWLVLSREYEAVKKALNMGFEIVEIWIFCCLQKFLLPDQPNLILTLIFFWSYCSTMVEEISKLSDIVENTKNVISKNEDSMSRYNDVVRESEL